MYNLRKWPYLDAVIFSVQNNDIACDRGLADASWTVKLPRAGASRADRRVRYCTSSIVDTIRHSDFLPGDLFRTGACRADRRVRYCVDTRGRFDGLQGDL